jgi:hypothetical protein
MNILVRFKKFREIIYGSWMDEVVDGIKCTTAHVCDRIDELRDRAIINGEAHWLNKDVKWPSDKSKEGPLI